MKYSDMMMDPDILLIQRDDGWAPLERLPGGAWARGDAEINLETQPGAMGIGLRAGRAAIHRIAFKWLVKTDPGTRILGDCWERGYGDLEWRGIVPDRVMPWYFLLFDGQRTHGFGVKTAPNALCFWQVSEECVTLCLDVRCGGAGVELNGRNVSLATAVFREGEEGETPFRSARAFMRALCPAPVLPPRPVYGGNNWYYAYGRSSHEEIIGDSRFIASLAAGLENRPFMVIDEGWALPRSAQTASLWRRGNERHPDMGKLACQMKEIGVRPGIWVRPTSAPDSAPDALCLPASRFKDPYPGKYLDPSIPEALDIVRGDIAAQVQWGYELIKHDYSTFDILGRWGFEMGGDMTNGGWHFADRTRTTAEIIGSLYRAIGQAAGGALLIGCNTVGHIGAGIYHMQRTGDDTSGRQWERTRRMGVNTLAFAMPKHGAFYASDADCAGITDDVPWEMNRQWLQLLSGSGTPLFVSASPKVGPEQRQAIRKAFEAASREIPPAEPLDWMDTTCPAKWLLNGEEAEFRWNRRDAVEFLRP